MIGYDIYLRALSLLGYNNRFNNASDSEHLLRRAHTAVCEICADLGVQSPEVVTDKIEASAKALEVMPYGVAMLLALSEGDAASNRFFAEMYNAKRAAVKACISYVSDVLPVDDGGTV